MFVKYLSVNEYADLSIKTAHAAIERIKANIFWPARADENGRLYDFGRIFSISPEKDFGSGDEADDWLKRQQAKLKGLENA